MHINNLKIHNFKSYSDIDINLDNFNVIIGANSSGKSNFLEIYKFLLDISEYGLNNAISIQGRTKTFRNLKIGPSENFELRIDFNTDTKYVREYKDEYFGVKSNKFYYYFEIKFIKGKKGYKVVKDILQHTFDIVKMERSSNKLIEGKKITTGEKFHINNDRRISITGRFNSNEIDGESFDFITRSVHDNYTNISNDLLLELPTFPFIIPFRQIFKEISIYNFYPDLSKRAFRIRGKNELEEDGKNLAIVLKTIIDYPSKKDKLLNLLNYLLPIIKDINIDTYGDRSLLIMAKEKYYNREFLPATCLSDGTINIIALLVALFFENKKIAIFEEPERNIHPALLQNLVELLKRASLKKQIIITTHNPQIIKYTNISDLIFIRRKSDGFSYLTRPSNSKETKTFLENNIGIENLFIDNIL